MKTKLPRKSWFSLAQASKQLIAAGAGLESDADLLQLALEGGIVLSVVFSESPTVEVFRPVAESEIKYVEVPTLDLKGTIRLVEGGPVFRNSADWAFRRTTEICDLTPGHAYPLAMIGGEVADIEALLWKAHKLPCEPTTNLDGTFCRVGEGETSALLRLVAPFGKGRPGHYPIGCLPESAMIVVSDKALSEALGLSDAAHALPGKGASMGITTQWPWGEHSTSLLGLLAAAASRFWLRYDASDPSTAPTNQQVSDWLVERKVSRNVADVVATLLRADGLPTGPRKG